MQLKIPNLDFFFGSTFFIFWYHLSHKFYSYLILISLCHHYLHKRKESVWNVLVFIIELDLISEWEDRQILMHDSWLGDSWLGSLSLHLCLSLSIDQVQVDDMHFLFHFRKYQLKSFPSNYSQSKSKSCITVCFTKFI